MMKLMFLTVVCETCKIGQYELDFQTFNDLHDVRADGVGHVCREHETPRDVAQKFDLASGFQLVQANWTAGMWSALELSQFSRLVSCSLRS